MKLILETKNTKLLALLEELARQLGVKVTSHNKKVDEEGRKPAGKRNARLYQLMKPISRNS
ncbi:MAG: hypothetical protein U5L96_08160 [Owenweeksia sp.]|nr:hypothetical protein [Owenweeksia sp.]